MNYFSERKSNGIGYARIESPYIPNQRINKTAAKENRSGTYDVYLGVAVTHIAHDASILHFVHVLARDHILIARRCNNNVYISNDFIELHHSEAVHAVMRQYTCM